MAKMYFAKTVKYKGVTYSPQVRFEVDRADVEELKAAGGWLVEEKPKEEKKVVEEAIAKKVEEVKEEVKKEVKEEKPVQKSSTQKPKATPVKKESK